MSLGVEPDRLTVELRALAHPIRLRILSLLTGAAMTAAELARELGLTHANASYHLRQLLSAGQIEAAGEERIRGGMAKRYRYTIGAEVPSLGRADLPELVPQRTAVFAALASELRRRAKHLRPGPGRQHFTDAELWVDPAVWDEAKSLVSAASDLLHRAAQPPRSAGAVRTNATFAMFEMEPDQ